MSVRIGLRLGALLAAGLIVATGCGGSALTPDEIVPRPDRISTKDGGAPSRLDRALETDGADGSSGEGVESDRAETTRADSTGDGVETDPGEDGYLVPDGLTDALPAAETDALSITVPADGRLYGGDISWPQCPKGMGIPQKQGEGMPMPKPESRFVIIGLTNGPSFYPNPCLSSQLTWVSERGLLAAAYAVVSYPHGSDLADHGNNGPYNGSTRLGALRNVGYQAARFNIATMKQTGFRSPIVWIDVEPVRVFEWSQDHRANAAVVEGTVRGYRDAGYRVGFYSTPLLWRSIVGDLRFGEPEWRAAGPTSEAEALRRCAGDWSIQGGPAILGQWVEDRRDRNVTCPGAVADLTDLTDLTAWFAQY